MSLIKKKNICRLIVLCALFLAYGKEAAAAFKSRLVQEGNELYHNEKYEDSAKKFNEALNKDPESDIINFNLGTAYYKFQDYEKSLHHLQKALLSEDDALKEKTSYNLGNTLYQLGIARENDNIDLAISMLEKSLSQIESALKLDNKDEDAKHNYEFVKKELERLRKKKQKQEKQQQQHQNQEQEKQQDQEEQKNQENQESQQNQAGEQKDQEGEQDQAGNQEKEKKKQAEQSAESGEKEDTQKENDAKERQPASGRSAASKALSEKEAEMLLDDYKHSEEPQEMLQFMKMSDKEESVKKDW